MTNLENQNQEYSLKNEVLKVFKDVFTEYPAQEWKCFTSVFFFVVMIHDDYGTAKSFFDCQNANPSGEIKNAMLILTSIVTSFRSIWNYMRITDEDHRHVLLGLTSLLAVYGAVGSINLMFMLIPFLHLIPLRCISVFIINILELVTTAEVVNLILKGISVFIGTVVYDIRDWINEYIENKILY